VPNGHSRVLPQIAQVQNHRHLGPDATASAKAPAKLNLGLHVLRRRKDGYHDVETALLAVEWCDDLSFHSADSFSFTCSDPSLPTDERNLCVRAARAISAASGEELRGHLHLEKRLPHGAGLGGGSSDAASVLRLLCGELDLGLAPSDLHDIAAELGSDVPFFLHDQPMLATGRGDTLEPLGVDRPYSLEYALAVVMPAVQVSTAEAYGLVRPSDEGRADLREVVQSGDLERWRRELVNDFEGPILAKHPEIAIERERLLEAGAGYSALSGSGAAVFGIFESNERARQAAEQAEERGLTAWWGYAESSSRNSSNRSRAQVCCSSPVHS
jgi:4-diphosphocytidyl-2-C-methyl-D-erythritol kinase